MPVSIIVGDCRTVLPTLTAGSVHCCVTSPPYFGLRDYGVDGQMGLEQTPDEYVDGMVAVFREVRRVLRDDGTLWLNIGDSYAGPRGAQGHRMTPESVSHTQIANHPKRASQTGTVRADGVKPKDLYGIPWMLAFALRSDGWYLRQDIIWSKPNPMPESVTDRCTKAHEYLFLLSKSQRYYFNAEAIKERAVGGLPGNKTHKGKTAYDSGDEKMRTKAGLTDYCARVSADPSLAEKRNRRSVWTVTTKPFKGAHFATFPPDLVEPCILAGCPTGGTVLDPFGGAGTTGLVAARLGRNATLVEMNPDYAKMARKRIDYDDIFEGLDKNG